MKIHNNYTNTIDCSESLLIPPLLDLSKDPIFFSVVSITFKSKERCIVFGFEEETDLESENFILAAETGILLFSTGDQWGIILLIDMQLQLYEYSNDEYFFLQKIAQSVLLEKELEARLYDLKGNFINSVPIDPPCDRIVTETEIIYNSPIYGRQCLSYIP